MFFNSQTQLQKQEYQNYLQLVGYLSNLFTDSKTPYLYYRIAEKIFCKAFQKIAEFGKDKNLYKNLSSENFVYKISKLRNAKGRKQDFSEVYIPIPIAIHKRYPDFFPARDEQFNLKLPNGNMMLAKVCQDGNKALMSYSNKELGRWILRDVLKLKEGELLSYQRLQILGIDSVRIDKLDNKIFEINFTSTRSYEYFIST